MARRVGKTREGKDVERKEKNKQGAKSGQENQPE